MEMREVDTVAATATQTKFRVHAVTAYIRIFCIKLYYTWKGKAESAELTALNV